MKRTCAGFAVGKYIQVFIILGELPNAPNKLNGLQGKKPLLERLVVQQSSKKQSLKFYCT